MDEDKDSEQKLESIAGLDTPAWAFKGGFCYYQNLVFCQQFITGPVMYERAKEPCTPVV